MKSPTISCAIIDDEKIALDRLNDILNKFEALKVTGAYLTYHDALENLIRPQRQIRLWRWGHPKLLTWKKEKME
jgi:hypothetical protein